MNIQRKKMTERDYRMLEKVSYSSLKTFDNDRMAFYKEFILKEKVERKENDDMLRGMVVECLLYEPHLFDEKFYISCVGELPNEGTNLYKFVKMLFKKTKNGCAEGFVENKFEDLMVETYKEVGIKSPKIDKFLDEFVESDAMQWYREMRMDGCMTVISSQMADSAERIVKGLKECKAYQQITSEVDGQTVEVAYQFAIEYEYEGIEMKSLVDQMIIDHRTQTIQPYDLKCSWSVEDFTTNYLKMKYYIQAGLYDVAIRSWLDAKGMKGWKVRPMKFILCHSIGSLQPLIYSLSTVDVMMAMTGYTYRGRQYKGVRDIVQDLKWALESEIWNISRENWQFINQCKLDIKYE